MIPKFRAWDRLTGKMFPVGIIDYSIQSIYIEEPNGLYGERDFDEVELMQSTGLFDVNGMEIFEGDIVKIPDDYGVFGKNAGETCKVIFDSGCFRLKTSRGRGRGFWFEDDSTVTIIGNVWENPELVEEE